MRNLKLLSGDRVQLASADEIKKVFEKTGMFSPETREERSRELATKYGTVDGDQPADSVTFRFKEVGTETSIELPDAVIAEHNELGVMPEVENPGEAE